MTGRLDPVVGADTLMVRSTIRSGYGNARGPTEITGVDGVVGIFGAPPIKAWSCGTRGEVAIVAICILTTLLLVLWM